MDETLEGFQDPALQLDLNEAIDEEDLLQMEQDEQELITEEIVPTEAVEETQQTQTPSTEGQQNQQPQQKGNAAKTTAEAALSVPTGALDWGIGAFNKVMPGEALDLPEIPKFQNEVTQSIRDISSVVVPTIFITKGLGAAGTAANAKVGWKIGADPFVKWISNAGIAGMSGVIADEFAPVQERDHNMMGMLKETWPRTYGWVSDDWATLDDDEPYIKRAKNRNEGLFIGFGTDVLVGAGRLAKSLKGVTKATQWIPENEKASVIIKAMDEPKLSDDPLENVVLQSAKRRYDQTTEFGDVRITKSVNLDEPVLGYHDLYDYT